MVAQVRADLVRFFPQLAGRAITHAWGGPIDVSPTHRPAIVGLRGLPAWVAFGYTGNGVAPAHLFGRTLAALSLDRREPVTRLPFVDPAPHAVPPEPVRIAGAAVIRRALVRKEAAEEAGRRPDPVSAGLAALPRLLGLAHREVTAGAQAGGCPPGRSGFDTVSRTLSTGQIRDHARVVLVPAQLVADDRDPRASRESTIRHQAIEAPAEAMQQRRGGAAAR